MIEEAGRLLDQCGIERAPVDLVRIARHMGIRRIRELDVRLDGQLVELGDGGYEVILSRHAPHTRRRFTLAHEIAHILVASVDDGSMSCGDEPTEELCNNVAAELLMPGRFIPAEALAGMDVAAFRQLATRFQCSLEATGWRILNMGHVAGALLIWRQQDTGGLELSASPHTFGFDAPFENGDVLDGAAPFVRQLMQQSQGAVTYGAPPSGRIYTGRLRTPEQGAAHVPDDRWNLDLETATPRCRRAEPRGVVWPRGRGQVKRWRPSTSLR